MKCKVFVSSTYVHVAEPDQMMSVVKSVRSRRSLEFWSQVWHPRITSRLSFFEWKAQIPRSVANHDVALLDLMCEGCEMRVDEAEVAVLESAERETSEQLVTIG